MASASDFTPPSSASMVPAGIAVGYAALVVYAAPATWGDWAAIALSRAWGVAPALMLLAAVMLMVTMVADARAGRERSAIAIVRNFAATRIAPGHGVAFAMPLFVAAGTGAAYMIFKQQVLPLSGFGADQLLADIDRSMLGTDAWRISHSLFPGPVATWIIDLAYHPFFFPMTFGIALCLLLPLGSVARYRYMLGYALVLIGPASVLSWLVPGVGPCFDAALHHASRYAPLMRELGAQQAWLAAHHDVRLVSLDNQAGLMTLFRSDQLVDGAGISAMPSIHNALSTLFICFVLSLRPRLAWLMIPYGALILVGSVHLGWHYLADSIGGIGFAIGIWLFTGVVARTLQVGEPASHAVPDRPGSRTGKPPRRLVTGRQPG